MFRCTTLITVNLVIAAHTLVGAGEAEERYPDPIDLNVPHISTDSSVKYDYDIVYVRVPRKGDDTGSKWAEIAHPVSMDPGGDLLLLHPDGSEEVRFIRLKRTSFGVGRRWIVGGILGLGCRRIVFEAF
jgi:hypothetical protein